MINSIKNNQMLLNKHVPFSRLKAYIQQRTEKHLPLSNQGYAEEQIAAAKKQVIAQIRKDRKRNKIISFLSIAITITVVGTAAYYLIFTPRNWDINQPSEEARMEALFEKEQNLKKFYFYMADGKQWLAKGNLHNAVFQFGLATSIKPSDSQANILLTKALLQLCLTKSEECEQAINKLHKTEKLVEKESLKKQLFNYLLPFSDTSAVEELITPNTLE